MRLKSFRLSLLSVFLALFDHLLFLIPGHFFVMTEVFPVNPATARQ